MPRGEKTKLLWKNSDYRKMMSDKHKGYKMPDNQKEKIRQKNKGRAFRGSGYKLPLWDRLKKSEAQKGEKHWRWKGGLNRFRGSDWSIKRKLCYERDNWICQRCGLKCNGKNRKNKKGVIQAHHIDQNCKNHDLKNLITFCKTCHQKVYKELRNI